MKNEMETIKEYLEEYLQGHTNYYNVSRRNYNRFICRHPNHQESRPSMSLNPKNKKYCHCFACGASLSIIDMVIIDYAIGDINEDFEIRRKNKKNITSAIDKIKELFNMKKIETNTRYNPYVETKAKTFNHVFRDKPYSVLVHEYFDGRGFKNTDSILYHFRCILKDDCLLIPYQKINSDILTYTSRVIIDADKVEKEDRYKHYGKMTVYDYDEILTRKEKRIIFLTEGEIDALSVYDIMQDVTADDYNNYLKGKIDFEIWGAVALGGINNTFDFYKKIDSIECKDDIVIVICTDNDRWGNEAKIKIAKELKKRKVKFITHSIVTSGKDINDSLCANRDELKQNILDVIANHKRYILLSKIEVSKRSEDVTED